MNIIKQIGHKIGIDKSIAYSSGARIVQGFTGVGSMFFISTFLTGVEQGFYFTFGSILALQVFFELGLTGIMTQYVAHEASHLTLDENKIYQGEERYKSRLASLLRFCIKWYSILGILVFVFLMVMGQFYFNRYGTPQGDGVEWQLPWILICLGTTIKLVQSPIHSIVTGLGFVKETSKITFYQQIIIPATTWLGLACGLKLYVTGISYLLSVLLWQTMAVRMGFWRILINLLKVKVSETVQYMNEIFPFQWKIALSWVSGYFTFQLFNPVLFATEGAIVAGQMGMTLTALNAIQSLSQSWLNTKVPLYSKLIALKDYFQLDKLFNKTLKQMSMICVFLLVSFFVFIALLRFAQVQYKGSIFADRFLDYLPMLLMMIPVFLNQFVFSWAIYLRCHKKEPFLIISVVTGVLCLLSTFCLGNAYGLYGITLGYCAITIATVPWAYHIFKTKKQEWHHEQ